MKFLITAIIIATFCFPAKAQTNLIEQMNVVDGFDDRSFEEFADYYFPQGTLGSPYDVQAHYYWIYSGNFIATPGGDCTGKMELGYL